MDNPNVAHSAHFLGISGFLQSHSGKVIFVIGVLTLLLLVPLFALGSDEEASASPSGEVIDLQEDLDDRFQSIVLGSGYIVEAREGDVLTQPVLWELYQNTQELLAADDRGELAPNTLPEQPYLYKAFDLDTNRPITGVSTFADEVQRVLVNNPTFGTSLETATDEQIKVAIHLLLSDPQTSDLADALSVGAERIRRQVDDREIDYWTAPGLFFSVLADNQKLGGGSVSRGGIGADETLLDKEEFNRNVQRLLRGDEQTYRMWGIAIDQNLESADEGQIAGIFIMFTVMAAVAIVGIALRSYWATVLTGAGLSILIIWLKGISNLVGLKGGVIIELIVPIAMIALGVDFAVHAIRRYQEGKRSGYPPAQALRVGLGGVLGALTLAMLSDSVAFLSNTSSGIESVIHFGIAAGIASAASFVILGIAVPLVMMRIDQLRGPALRPTSRVRRVMAVVNGAGAGTLYGLSVLMLTVGYTTIGVVALAGTTVGFLLIPVFILRRRNKKYGTIDPSVVREPVPVSSEPSEGALGVMVLLIARHRFLMPIIAAGITVAAVFFAMRLDATFDVKDFFASKSDFVVSLDKLDEHIAEKGGEPGIIYIRGDLTDPEALAAVNNFVERVSANPYVAKDADGDAAFFDLNIMNMLARITESDYARARVQETVGVEITDFDQNAIPDSRVQLRAAFDYMVENGVPRDENTLVFDPGRVREVLYHVPGSGQENVTFLTIGIPGSREQTNVTAAREALTEDLAILSEASGIAQTGITGSPFVREAQLKATTDTLQRSLPIAVAAILVLLLVAMRSLRFAVVTIIPVGLVAAWLYALMYLLGFSLNFVTATIGAISIGVGIDYTVHMTERFREELRLSGDRMKALERAANSTGLALVVSALSSIVGFAILGFAPMPLFSAYGILTAIMIFLALTASLVVLPSLLLLVTSESTARRASATVWSVASESAVQDVGV